MATPTVEELMGEPPLEDDDAEFDIEVRRKRRKRGHEKDKEEPEVAIEKRTDIYRETRIGRALMSSLAQLKSENKIQGNLAETVLQQFDRSVARNLHYVPQNIVFTSESVSYYRLLDDRWKFKLIDVIFSEPDKELARVDSCTILASLAKDITI